MRKLITKQLDIKNEFLEGKKSKGIYICLPLGHKKRIETNFSWVTCTWFKVLDGCLKDFVLVGYLQAPYVHVHHEKKL